MRRKGLLSDRSGATAVEFAIVAPVFFMLFLGIMSYGYVFGVHHELRQMAAEAARASVAGITNNERESLATAHIARVLPSYRLLDTRRMSVTSQVRLIPVPAFHVIIAYDLTGSFPYQLATLLPLPAPRLEKRAVVGLGGY